MKQEERNRISKQKILKSATEEFARFGYAGASMNHICSNGGISKGILYHYYKDKDELYLSCLKACFDGLICRFHSLDGQTDAILESYFQARLRYFLENPAHHRIFCDAVISPQPHLKERITALKAELDQLNAEWLTKLLEDKKLREGLTLEQTVHFFRRYQDFANQVLLSADEQIQDVQYHSKASKWAVELFLYGVVARDDSE